MSKDYYQSYEYWFEKKEHGIDSYDENYYAYRIFQHLLPQLNIPSEGFVVILGSHNCNSLNLLGEIYGRNRLRGYDLYNPTNNDKVIIKDIITLDDSDNIPIAFCFNDVGSFPTTPEVKMHAQIWAAKNIVSGGVMLGRNNKNSKQFKLEELMIGMGFKNLQFADLDKDKFDLSVLSDDEIATHMFSIKAQ